MNRRLLTVISLILLFALAVPLFAGCHDDDEGELIQKAKDEKRHELLDAGYSKAEAEKWLNENEDQWNWLSKEYNERIDREIAERDAATATAAPVTTKAPDEPKGDFDPTNGYWKLIESYIRNAQHDYVDEDELQKITYSYTVGTERHTFSLKYEPLDEDDIPEYEIRVLGECLGMPSWIEPGDRAQVSVEAYLTKESEYAALALSCWLYLEDDSGRVTLVCDDGYSKGDIFAGTGDKGRKESMSATFSLTVPEDDIANTEEFNVVFQTEIGESVFHYQWISYNYSN